MLPNMKHGLFEPEHVVSVGRLAELRGIRLEATRDGRAGRYNGHGGEVLTIGAGMRLGEIAESVLVQRGAPALAEACGQVGGPHHRAMGTLGGNVCLDTRCVYYNQTYFWRKALGFCLKKDGTLCHVVQGGQRCVAAASNDTAPVLMTLGARVRAFGPSGVRELPVSELYVPDGIANTVLSPDELVVEVRVPKPEARTLMGYQKLRVRSSIDYPALTIAVAAKLDSNDRVEWIRTVVSALGARPHWVGGIESFRGRRFEPGLVAEVAQVAHR